MRKQTKLVAVASAAALLAVGASMTSFAATGWVEEDGQWYFYDKDGNRVEDAWKKSGDNWYWLDSEEGGAMAIDKLVDDGEDTYYVDSNGVMVRNTWVKIVNEEQDDESDPAEYNYYYMQSNGKAYKTKTNSTHFKTIDGKRFAFDDEGKMLYGWVNSEHERVDSDNWHDEGMYYLGEWDDGAVKVGWQKIYVKDNEDDDEEKAFWFHFKANGEKRYANTANRPEAVGDILEKKINGKKYGFDYRGVMVYEWTLATTNHSAEAVSTTSSWKYFSNPEDGARLTKGWFKVVAPEEDNDNVFMNYGEGVSFAKKDADEENERWYYANGDGNLEAGKIKKIKGKYYAFRPEDLADSDENQSGAMLTGLVLMRTKGDKIIKVLDDDVDSDALDDIIKKNIDKDGNKIPADATLFYFGNDEDHDGAMKTGNVTVNLDGDSYNFKFSKSGGAEGKGKGITGLDDKKYVYKYGLKLKAGSDDKYQVVYVKGDTANSGSQVAWIDSQELRDCDITHKDYAVNKDGDSVSFLGEVDQVWNTNFKLLSTSGAIVTNKTAARDGADWYFYVDKEAILMYSNSKTLKADSDDAPNKVKLDSGLANWKKWAANEKTNWEEDKPGEPYIKGTFDLTTGDIPSYNDSINAPKDTDSDDD